MKKLMLAATSLLALTATASAADLSPRTYTKAPPAPIAAINNWSGFYIGGFGGYAWSDRVRADIPGVGVLAGNTDDIKGGFGGGTIGRRRAASFCSVSRSTPRAPTSSMAMPPSPSSRPMPSAA